MLRDHDFTDYRSRRVTVMGLGAFGGGVGAVRFLAERGAVVTVTDLRPREQLAESIAELSGANVARWTLGGHIAEDFTAAELVVVNPAVRRDHPLLELCRSRGVPLTSEMNLFWQHNPATVLAVTGSNGKSTTTALLHNILRCECQNPVSASSSARERAGMRGLNAPASPHPLPHWNGGEGAKTCWLGGNLGRSLLPMVDEIRPHDWVVLELSSFQLADLDRLQVSPHVAVVTNFSPNHLDWHGTLDDYRRAKQTILRWQRADDVYVVNADDPDVRTWIGPGQRREFGLVSRDVERLIADVQSWLKLPGRHNLMNALAAATAALAVGADLAAVRRGLETYEPLPHRLQFVGEAAGRRFYNDSLATTPESTLVALDAFTEPIVLLAGGYDKRVDLGVMAAAIARNTKAVALMGQTASRLANQIASEPRRRTTASEPLPDFRTAFAWAVAHSSPGDVVLLSPGCASYDWFRNFADRGEQFTALARAWMAQQSTSQ